MKIKNINVKWGMLFLLFACSGCEDLEVTPDSILSEENFFTTTKEINTVAVSMYDGLQQVFDREFSITEMRTDNLTVLLAEGEWGRLDELNVDPTSDLTLTHWQNAFLTVNRANVVLENLEVVVEDAFKRQFEGEAKFVRALVYFNLVRLFGDVPLLTTVADPNDPDQFLRTPAAQVYAQIENDLNDAASSLPSDYSGDNIGRATSGAAKGLLAKVLVTQDKFSEARPVLEDVMDDGFTLQTEYAEVFSLSNEYNDEILFAVRYKGNAGGEGNQFSYDYAINSIGFVATDDIMGAYEAGDERKAGTLAGDRNIKFNDLSAAVQDASNDWIVLRFADVILLYAEVLNELEGVSTAAVNELNKIRERAGLPVKTVADFANQEALRNAIRAERRIELAFEDHRWFDLQRYGSVGVQILESHLGISVSANQLLLPIPQREIDVSQGIITQNTGY